MSEIYFLYSAMGCIALFGFLYIFFDDRFMNFKTILLMDILNIVWMYNKPYIKNLNLF